MLKKIAIIGTVGLPSNYGGFETLTEYLTKYLGDKFDFTVFCSSKSYKKKIKTYNNAKLKYLPLNANGIQSIFYDILSIFYALFFADVLLSIDQAFKSKDEGKEYCKTFTIPASLFPNVPSNRRQVTLTGKTIISKLYRSLGTSCCKRQL